MGENVKHTPGPWQIEFGHTQTASGIQYWQVTDGADAICCNQFCYAGDAEANARLIASAPELLKLAAQYRDDLHHPPSPDSKQRRLAAIEAVISKAEGRP